MTLRDALLLSDTGIDGLSAAQCDYNGKTYIAFARSGDRIKFVEYREDDPQHRPATLYLHDCLNWQPHKPT